MLRPAAPTPRADVPHVVIVGGGIAGLAVAERLAASAAAPRVTVLEAAERVGGILGTERAEGFVIERGPDVMLASKPAARLLCERLGIAHRLQGTAPGARGAYILSRGRLRRLPSGWSGLVPARLWPLATSGLLSMRGLARVATEPFRAPRRDPADESVRDFAVRRLGVEAWERLTEPMLSGIYGADGARLSMRATLPQLRALEQQHGSILRGLRAGRKQGETPGRAPFLSLPGGMQELVDALELSLLATTGVEIRRQAAVAAVEPPPHAAARARVRLADGEVLEADAVVIATPAHGAARLLATHDALAVLAEELAGIAYGSMSLVTLGFRRADVPHPLDATGYVVPRVERREVAACTWSSSKFAGRAPGDMALIRCFLGGAHHPALPRESDATLLAIARAELERTLGIAAAPALVRIARWLDAMPQYHLGHGERVQRIEREVEAHRWLALAGNAYYGVGIPDTIACAERAADRIAGALAVAAPFAASA